MLDLDLEVKRIPERYPFTAKRGCQSVLLLGLKSQSLAGPLLLCSFVSELKCHECDMTLLFLKTGGRGLVAPPRLGEGGITVFSESGMM